MPILSRWFDISDLCTPFLAINVSNRRAANREANDQLLRNNKTGHWSLPKDALNQGIEKQTIVLFYAEKGVSKIYMGTCVSKEITGQTKNDRPRYTLAVDQPWKLVGETEVSFTELFRGFKLSSNPTVVWADIQGYSYPSNENRCHGEERDHVDDSAAVEGFNRPAMVQQRVGHEIFVQRLSKYWRGQCALTNLNAPRLVQACHIVPWSEATPAERVNRDNGLLLCTHLHALFDSHLLGFDSDGQLLLARDIDAEIRRLVLANGSVRLRKSPTKEQAAFLQRHRNAAKDAGHVLVRV